MTSSSGFISGTVNRFTYDRQRSFYQPPALSGETQVKGWQAWAASEFLETRGEWQKAKVWIICGVDALSPKPDQQRLLRAEVLGLAGRLMFAEGDTGDALPSLVESGKLWQDLAESSRSSSDPEVERLGDEIREMVTAFDPEHKIIRPQGLVQSKWLIERWTEEILLDSWSTLAATQARALAAAGRHAEAQSCIDTMKRWMRGAFYLPPNPERLQNELRLAEYAIMNANKEQLKFLMEGFPEVSSKEELLALRRKQIEEDTKDDLRIQVLRDGVVPLWRLFMAEGDVHLASGKVKDSVQAFEFAIRVWDEHVVNYEDLHMVAQALFNQGNSYLRIQQYQEARRNYARCMEYFDKYDPGSLVRARHADLVARWKLNPEIDIAAEARQMLIEWESQLRNTPAGEHLHINKAALSPLYQLTLSIQAHSSGPEAAFDYYDILEALREGTALTNWGKEISPWWGNEDDSPSKRSLQVLSGYLSAIPSTVILFLQNGVEELTYLALRSSNKTGEAEVCTLSGAVTPEVANVFGELLERHQVELAAVYSGRTSEYAAASSEFLDCCTRAWKLLPEEVRSWLDNAETIVVSPDPFGNFDKVPFELFRMGDSWLGIERTITRVSSTRTLLKMLSRQNTPQSNRGVVVRSEDPPGFVKLQDADAEVDQVMRYMRLLDLEAERAERLDAPTLLRLLDDGFTILHYCGHGLATSLGEGLPLGNGQTLQPTDLVNLSGKQTPFVYLSACEVGRTRYVAGGRQTGLATGLLENGAPAVVGCLHAVPDGLASLMAKAFYRAAKTNTTGQALSTARRVADGEGINPAMWGVYAFYGDPRTTISGLQDDGR